MADQWYYSRQGKDFGPVTPAQLKQLADAGQLQPTDEVWKGGMNKRVPARAVKGLFPAPAGQQGTATATAAPAPQRSAPRPEESQRSTVKSSAPTPAPEEDLVELIAVEPEPMPYVPGPPQPYVQHPYPPQQPHVQPQLEYPAPGPIQAAGPMRAEVVENELEPLDDGALVRPRLKKKAGGSKLGLWLGLGGGGLVLVILVVVLILVLRGGNKITRENHAKIKRGMTVAEVTDILGAPYVDQGIGPGRMMVWRDGDNMINVMFSNGRVEFSTFRQQPSGANFDDMDFKVNF